MASICRDCIELDRVVTLGDTSGSGYVVSTEYAVRDSLGRYWLGQYHDMLKVFDSTGQYLRQVGRPGDGPMEFSVPWPEYTDAAGRVHVVDAELGRETVISPDFTLYATDRLPASMWFFTPLRDGTGYVGNGPGPSGGRDGLPLHLIRGTRIVRSFGRSDIDSTNLTPRTVFHLIRAVATGPDDRIYSAAHLKYAINVWTADGHWLREIIGPDEVGRITDENAPPVTAIHALWVERADRLWVLIDVRRPDWRDHMHLVNVGGRRILQPIDGDVGALLRSRIDVIDLATDAVIARTDLHDFFTSFVGNGLLLQDRMTPSGVPQVVMWKATWHANPAPAARSTHPR